MIPAEHARRVPESAACAGRQRPLAPYGGARGRQSTDAADTQIQGDFLMKAARFYGPGDIRIDDVPLGTVMVEVEWCGICGTDLAIVEGPIFVPAADAPHRRR